MTRCLIVLIVAGCSNGSNGAPTDGRHADAKPDAYGECNDLDAGVGCGSGEYCQISFGGVEPILIGNCVPLPTACLATPTCTCLTAQITCGTTFMCSGSGAHINGTCPGI